ncbi:DUF3224 domain-containing protein [Actinomadura parmotrematis]|uniref:DUF3224 domain-containing protein n=1 Tax=Actinomadura parmotrematis TaxID=2864039 RepID=A0ABS7FU11_9ACTN|nr:DUF3224 domain-containing protein [Actinomadura parmotrematis]MBW8483877.1 DUF3224 domain-containing protein [Actinomadura parmotrematis]
MTSRASGTFEIKSWDAGTPFQNEGGVELTRVQVTRAFHGDLVGSSTAELITVRSPAGPAAYVGVETVRGILHGREGTFVLQHNAGSDDGGDDTQWLDLLVVPATGTGELAGVRGRFELGTDDAGGHAWSLEYTLG